MFICTYICARIYIYIHIHHGTLDPFAVTRTDNMYIHA